MPAPTSQELKEMLARSGQQVKIVSGNPNGYIATIQEVKIKYRADGVTEAGNYITGVWEKNSKPFAASCQASFARAVEPGKKYSLAVRPRNQRYSPKFYDSAKKRLDIDYVLEASPIPA